MKYVIRDNPTPSKVVELWLSTNSKGEIVLEAEHASDGDHWGVLRIAPDGRINRIGFLPPYLGFALDEAGRVRIS